MDELRVDRDWVSNIAKVRDSHTEDTNLIRFDNGFYRVCRDQPGTFELRVVPGLHGKTDGVSLTMRWRDLYVTEVGGEPFTTYAATIDTFAPEALGLNSAVQGLARGETKNRFELQSLLVFCVAESLRSDHVATKISQMIAVSTTGLIGVPKSLCIAELLPLVHGWGQTSDAIFKALSPEARAIAMLPRSRLTQAQRRFSERVDLTQVDASLRHFARDIKVLKRP
jgi:hypothetical protein